MTSELFRKWLTDWKRELRAEDFKRICLIVDNCSAHPATVELTNIELAFFPPNTMAILQPCDQRIIRAVKAHYRRHMILEIIQQMDDNDEQPTTACALAKKINLLDATELLVLAWSDLEAKTIRNCWRRSGLHSGEEEPEKGRHLTFISHGKNLMTT